MWESRLAHVVQQSVGTNFPSNNHAAHPLIPDWIRHCSLQSHVWQWRKNGFLWWITRYIYRFWGKKSCPTGNHYYVKLMVMTVPSAFSFFFRVFILIANTQLRGLSFQRRLLFPRSRDLANQLRRNLRWTQFIPSWCFHRYFFLSLLRGTDSGRDRDRASCSSTNASRLESTKRRKTRTAKHNRGRKRQILRTDSDERRFDQNLLNGYSNWWKRKKKMASSSERRFPMEFRPGLKGFERKFKCPYL